jgi:large subunit ribosomal protein L23
MYTLIRPIISEKSLDNTAKHVYMFEVEIDATKQAIKKAVEEQFKVNVVTIKTTIKKGIFVRQGKKRIKKMSKTTKKAMVEIKPDQKIDLFEVTK